MVIGMVSGAVKFFFPIPRFFSSHLPTSIYFSPPSHALSPYPSLYLSSFHFFFFNLYLSLFIFFLLSFFFYSFCFPFLPSHEFFFFFLFFSSLSLSLSSVQNLFRIVSDLFYSPIYNYFFPQPFRCVVCLFPFHSLFFFSCFFIFIFSIFQ